MVTVNVEVYPEAPLLGTPISFKFNVNPAVRVIAVPKLYS